MKICIQKAFQQNFVVADSISKNILKRIILHHLSRKRLDGTGIVVQLLHKSPLQVNMSENERRQVLSGTIHMAYYLGQKIDEEMLLKETENIMPSAKRKRRQTGTTAKGNKVGTTSTRSGVTLADLVESGMIIPKEDCMTISYKGASAVASLTPSGTIAYEGQEFQSATAFSIFFKRKITPSKQGDDGWKSVLYDGETLDTYRKALLEKRSKEEDSEQSRSAFKEEATKKPNKSFRLKTKS